MAGRPARKPPRSGGRRGRQGAELNTSKSPRWPVNWNFDFLNKQHRPACWLRCDQRRRSVHRRRELVLMNMIMEMIDRLLCADDVFFWGGLNTRWMPWIINSFVNKTHMNPSQPCRESSAHAAKRLLSPADWIRAARWWACASARPSSPCSSDSRSSAAAPPPVSGTLGTRPLTGTDTDRRRQVVRADRKFGC